MTWGCQAGVETANLTTVMKNYKITPTESSESIKLGIDAHAKWYCRLPPKTAQIAIRFLERFEFKNGEADSADGRPPWRR